MRRNLQIFIVLIAILILTAILRLVGIGWDNYSAVHPDERFVASISGSIGDKRNLLEEVKERCADESHSFFNTRCSSMNPVNVNEGSFAYGTFPIFIVHKTSEIIADLKDDPTWTTSTKNPLVARSINAVAELFSVFIIFLIGQRLFGPTHALLAAMLYAGAALPIQLAHFWTVDTIAHLCFMVALYSAVMISQTGRTWAFVLFGLALGAATASRANLLVSAVLAPVAVVIYLTQFLPANFAELSPSERRVLGRKVFIFSLKLILAALTSFVVFRIAQPYAFLGPSFWDVLKSKNSFPFIDLNWNPKWRMDLEEVANFASKRSDGWPPSHQWVGRWPYLYPWFNWLWGMGAGLWLIGTIAVAMAVIRQLQKRQLSPQFGLLTIWFLLYFAWQGQLHFMTLRYYLPLYAVVGLLAVWWTGTLHRRWRRVLHGVLVAVTFLWAFAFTAIYRQPQTRVEAAYWMYENIPATVNGRLPNGEWIPLNLATDEQAHSPFELFTVYNPSDVPGAGQINTPNLEIKNEIEIQKVWFRWVEPISSINFSLQLRDVTNESTEGVVLHEFVATSTMPHYLELEAPRVEELNLMPGFYRWQLNINWVGTADLLHLMAGVEWLRTETQEHIVQQIPFNTQYNTVPYFSLFSEDSGVVIDAPAPMTLSELFIPHQIGEPTNLILQIGDEKYTAYYGESDQNDSLLGEGRWYWFDNPVTLHWGFNNLNAQTPLWITGSTIITEGSWEDSTPARICWNDRGQDPGYVSFEDCRFFGAYDAKWFTELPLEVIEHDNTRKQLYLQDVLLKGDYLAVTTNRMYDALPRNQDFYWYTTEYYNALWTGQLGFEQVARFEALPQLGPFTFPDQVLPDENWNSWLNGLEAEEAFTVYDHPTIYIFRNTNFALSQMPLFTPRFDERNRLNLDEQPVPVYVASQEEPSDDAAWITTTVWAFGWILLSWITFPLMYLLFPILPLRGFFLGRVAAWLLLALIPWWLTAATGLPLWRRESLVIFLILLIWGNIALARRYRHQLIPYICDHWRWMIFNEIIWLTAFGFGIVLRGVNPDYWHPFLGGEKMMDLAYLNATIRTETFAPPNPWMSGFSINYYYLGFVIVGMPLKLFHIAPEIAPNLMLATLYATIFSLVGGLLCSILSSANRLLKIGLVTLGTAFIMLAGTYGTFQRMVNPIDGMQAHRWYWYPTRIIAEWDNGSGGIINEFPVFSFLYGDLHAHMIGLIPVLVLLIVVWTYLQQRSRWQMPIIGALLSIIFMTNVWDILVYIPLVAGIALYAALTSRGREKVILLAGLAFGGMVMIAPYLPDFTVGNNGNLKQWEGIKTMLEPFLLVWGAPLGVITVWLLHRTKVRLLPDADFPVELGMVILLALPVLASSEASQVTAILGSLLIITGALFVFDSEMRWVHLATGFFLSGLLAVDYVTINDDRMNTGFKVSYQLWIWVGLLMPVLLFKMIQARRAYLQVGFCIVLVAPTLLFTIKAIPARQEDSYTKRFTLNGYDFMNNMPYDVHPRVGKFLTISLNEDDELIRYMRANINGYPIIVEAYYGGYQWTNRISSYTGLPTVVGWPVHLTQQYAHQWEEIDRRRQAVQEFYRSTNPEQIRQFLRLYNVDYIVYGTLEQTFDDGPQLLALRELVFDGTLTVAYQNNSTRLYQVVK